MPSVTDVTRDAQEQLLENVELSQKAILEGFRTWTEAIEKIIPETPVPSFWREWPSAEESIDQAFDFAGRLLNSQREFVKGVVKAAKPTTERAARASESAADRAVSTSQRAASPKK